MTTVELLKWALNDLNSEKDRLFEENKNLDPVESKYQRNVGQTWGIAFAMGYLSGIIEHAEKKGEK